MVTVPVYVEVEACHDSTRVVLNCKLYELEFLERVSSLINKTSDHSCKPKMIVREWREEDFKYEDEDGEMVDEYWVTEIGREV